jgi:hypothetical protein
LESFRDCFLEAADGQPLGGDGLDQGQRDLAARIDLKLARQIRLLKNRYTHPVAGTQKITLCKRFGRIRIGRSTCCGMRIDRGRKIGRFTRAGLAGAEKQRQQHGHQNVNDHPLHGGVVRTREIAHDPRSPIYLQLSTTGSRIG